MREEDKILAKKLANEHWEWFHNVVGHVAMDFFVHGYKHGFSDTKCHKKAELEKSSKEGL